MKRGNLDIAVAGHRRLDGRHFLVQPHLDAVDLVLADLHVLLHFLALDLVSHATLFELFVVIVNKLL